MAWEEKQPVWAEISLPRLVENLHTMQKQAGDAELLAVVKADAYGHGAVPCALALAKAGVQWLGVTCAAEGAAVRAALQQQKLSARILLMRSLFACDAEAALRAGLTAAISDLAAFDALQAAASRLGLKSVAVHVEIDSGMTRQGISPEDLPELLARFAAGSALQLEGVMTHFASAEEAASPQNLAQVERLANALAQIRAAGLQPRWLHAGSTSTLDAGVAMPALRKLAASCGTRLMCRPGIGLYGYAMALTGAAPRVRAELKPVLAWKTRILALRQCAAGAKVGYNGTFVADTPRTLALLPVGYADGLRRELSSAGEVLIAGRRARIAGTISYEILCGIGKRVPRCY